MSSLSEIAESMPERECPICGRLMAFEAEDARSAPRYRCQRCGYSEKPSSLLRATALVVGAVVLLSIAAFFFGAFFANPVTPTQPGSTVAGPTL